MMDDPESWPTGRLLSTAARLVEQAWASHLDDRGVTHAGLVTLHALTEGPLSQRELADRCRVQAQTMSRIVARLERSGLVDRHPDPADARRLLVSRTEAGGRALQETISSRPEVVRLLDDGDDAAAFRRKLHHVVSELGHRRP